MHKYRTVWKREDTFDSELLLKTIQNLKLSEKKKYKKSFLVYIKDQILPVAVVNIAYFYLENERVYCVTFENEKFVIDQTLDKISSQTDPDDFFRINRQFIISRKAVKTVAQHFNRKLKLNLSPSPQYYIFISKTKAAIFKKWLEQ